MPNTRSILCFVLLVISLPAAGDAEWLVTREGLEIETRGPWKVRADGAFFTTADGQFSMLDRSEINLDRSRALTLLQREIARRRSAPRDADERTSVLRITDDDVSHSIPEPYAPTDPTALTAAAAPGADTLAIDGTEPGMTPPIQVLASRSRIRIDDGALIVSGKLESPGPDVPILVSLLLDGVRVSSAVAVTTALGETEGVDAFEAALEAVPGAEMIEFSWLGGSGAGL